MENKTLRETERELLLNWREAVNSRIIDSVREAIRFLHTLKMEVSQSDGDGWIVNGVGEFNDDFEQTCHSDAELIRFARHERETYLRLSAELGLVKLLEIPDDESPSSKAVDTLSTKDRCSDSAGMRLDKSQKANAALQPMWINNVADAVAFLEKQRDLLAVQAGIVPPLWKVFRLDGGYEALCSDIGLMDFARAERNLRYRQATGRTLDSISEPAPLEGPGAGGAP